MPQISIHQERSNKAIIRLTYRWLAEDILYVVDLIDELERLVVLAGGVDGVGVGEAWSGRGLLHVLRGFILCVSVNIFPGQKIGTLTCVVRSDVKKSGSIG